MILIIDFITKPKINVYEVNTGSTGNIVSASKRGISRNKES
jgi:hypothetical protein